MANENGELNDDLVRSVFSDLDNWYLKRSVTFQGGGEGVIAGSKLVDEPRSKAGVVDALKEDPHSYIAVRKLSGSATVGLAGEQARSVDFRALNIQVGDDSTALRHIYSRGAPIGATHLNSTGAAAGSSQQLVIASSAVKAPPTCSFELLPVEERIKK